MVVRVSVRKICRNKIEFPKSYKPMRFFASDLMDQLNPKRMSDEVIIIECG